MEENKQVAVTTTNTRAIAERITEDKLLGWMKTSGIAASLNDKEKAQFMEIALAFQLNPFKREIYCNAYGEGQYRQTSIIVGYEVYIKRAERTHDLAGWNVTTTGAVKSNDLKAIITIHRKSWAHPFVHEVEYDEYVARKKDGTITKFWADKPKTMIKKVAVSQGFRLCFSDELGGMPYTADELGDTSPITEAEVVKAAPAPVKPEIKMPSRQSASEPSAAELRAATAPASTTSAPVPTTPKTAPVAAEPKTPARKVTEDFADLPTATGSVSGKKPANGWGYVVLNIADFNKEDGYPVPFTTKEPELVAIVDSLKASDKVSIAYEKVTNAKGYTNYYIKHIALVELCPF